MNLETRCKVRDIVTSHSTEMKKKKPEKAVSALTDIIYHRIPRLTKSRQKWILYKSRE